ncbi:MAG: hypothetical protein U9Q39_07820, partial [Pseudomonadota bacterium]|nr:hypothetical protein [Pseudomonadota bacterium]
ASTFNRAYLNPNSKKYSIEAAEVLKKCKRAQCGDAVIIPFLRGVKSRVTKSLFFVNLLPCSAV